MILMYFPDVSNKLWSLDGYDIVYITEFQKKKSSDYEIKRSIQPFFFFK